VWRQSLEEDQQQPESAIDCQENIPCSYIPENFKLKIFDEDQDQKL
jgi:hypothetical protein